MENKIQINRFRQEREQLKKMARTVNNCPFPHPISHYAAGRMAQ